MNIALKEITGRPTTEALGMLESRPEGLFVAEAENRLKTVGPNELAQTKPKSLWAKLRDSLVEPMVLILLGAAVFSFVIGDWLEAVAILGVVLINTVIGLVQDAKAEKALSELKKMLSPTARVKRAGRVEVLAVKFLVPGDIILLEAGDIVPADARVVQAQNLLVDEAHLTGESQPVLKQDKALPQGVQRPYEALNCLFTGSRILDGLGQAVVYATGARTEMGSIATGLQSAEEEKTPLQQKLGRETKFLVSLALLSALAVLLVVVFKNWGLLFGASGFSLKIAEEAILLAVTIMVAVFPEGLPASITIALSLAVERLAKQAVIVKKLSSVETLGNVDFICTDKTGTITTHRMTAREFYLGGKFYGSADLFKLLSEGHQEILGQLFLAAARCSSASLEEKDGVIVRELGDPTELAILKAGLLSGFKPGEFDAGLDRVDHLPFSSDRMFSAALVAAGDGSKTILVQGAPEKVLHLCQSWNDLEDDRPLTSSLKEQFLRDLGTRQEKGFRLIALAQASLPADSTTIDPDRLPGLTWLGTCIIYDPPKDEVKQVIAEARSAHIAVVMITGDAKKTGYSIAESVGIADRPDQAVEGVELEALSPEAFKAKVEDVRVYSRVVPMDKLRVVEQLRANGHVTAMTGDGVNDAPALKKAHVGIAMGKAGTQVSQEAADIILTDDNFSTIVTAVKEGRTVYSNLKKVVRFLITNNLGKVLATLLTPLFGPGAALNALMLLWSNVVMETAPGVGLSTDRPSPDIMKKRPARQEDPILTRGDRWTMLFDGLVFGLMITAGYFLILHWNQGLANAAALAQTGAFIITLLGPQLSVFVMRDGRTWQKFAAPNPLLKGFTVFMLFMIPVLVFAPFCQEIFGTVALTDPLQWLVLIGLAAVSPVLRLVFQALESSRESP